MLESLYLPAICPSKIERLTYLQSLLINLYYLRERKAHFSYTIPETQHSFSIGTPCSRLT